MENVDLEEIMFIGFKMGGLTGMTQLDHPNGVS